MSFTDVEKKQLKIFVAVAFGLPVLMGILMGIGYYQGSDVSAFPTAPDVLSGGGRDDGGALYEKKDALIPKGFYILFLSVTVILAVLAVLSVLKPYEMVQVGNGYVLPFVVVGAAVAADRLGHCRVDYLAGN